MIIKTNQQYLNSTMQELLMNGLKLGKNASKSKDVLIPASWASLPPSTMCPRITGTLGNFFAVS